MAQRNIRQLIAIRRSIAARKAGETVAAAPVAKAPKAKRVMTEKQAAAWATIQASMAAGKARKKAEREAAAAEPVAA